MQDTSICAHWAIVNPNCDPWRDAEEDRALFEDVVFFDAHPDREWRCRRTWYFERERLIDRRHAIGVLFVIIHRTDVFRGRRYVFEAPVASFDPSAADDAFCRQAAAAIWRHDLAHSRKVALLSNITN
jgi:hypothetical protein